MNEKIIRIKEINIYQAKNDKYCTEIIFNNNSKWYVELTELARINAAIALCEDRNYPRDAGFKGYKLNKLFNNECQDEIITKFKKIKNIQKITSKKICRFIDKKYDNEFDPNKKKRKRKMRIKND